MWDFSAFWKKNRIWALKYKVKRLVLFFLLLLFYCFLIFIIILFWFYYIFFYGHTRHILKFPGQGLNLSYSCSLCHGCSSPGFLTHCAGPGIEPPAVRLLTHCATAGTPLFLFLIVKNVYCIHFYNMIFNFVVCIYMEESNKYFLNLFYIFVFNMLLAYDLHLF